MVTDALVCQNGHPIDQMRLKDHFYRGRTGIRFKSCRICNKAIDRADPRWKCSHHFCSYYVCQECYHILTAESLETSPCQKDACVGASTLLPVLALLAGQDHADHSEDEAEGPAVYSGCKPFSHCVCWPGWLPADSSASTLEASTELVYTKAGPTPGVERELSDYGCDTLDVGPLHGRSESEVFDQFADSKTALPIGGLVCEQPHSEYLLPPEVVLYEPVGEKMFGHAFEHGKPGRRFIFLNTKLGKTEQEGLAQFHKALEDEGVITSQGDSKFPLYVRIHALRILQQAKFNVKKALSVILTHLNMRLKWLPLIDTSMLEDLRSGLMYWHGRDRQGHPCLIWRLEKMAGFKSKEAAIKVVLFVMEYGVRYTLVPGRVENWILLVDLENVGLGHSTSTNTGIAKSAAEILESVFCGRNYKTKIFSLPWLIRSIVNSFIPEDKKDKVEFVTDADRQKVMMEMFEPNQVEERYGGSAPNLLPEQTYPYNFFPNCTGPDGSNRGKDKSLHTYTDRVFHEGALLDLSSEPTKARWTEVVKKQPLTPLAVEELAGMGVEGLKPCQDMSTWFQTMDPAEAQRRGYV